MANKTATLLIIDCSPTMAASKLFDNKVVSEGRSITRLNAAAHLAAETLKGNVGCCLNVVATIRFRVTSD